jgi:uncharacterized membrane protein YgcG
MHCPYCQNPVCEESPACPKCGLDMDKATAFFGTPPRLFRGLSDTAGVLSAGDQRSLRRAIREFERRFPQTGFTVAFMALPKDTPGPTYTWWVFNRCNPAGELHQASANRHLFLLVDVSSGGAWLTGGYGLEPFVSDAQWQQCLVNAHPHFASGRYADAVSTLLKEADAMLRSVIKALPRVFGLPQQQSVAPVIEPAAAW